jgi:hypothetical protein
MQRNGVVLLVSAALVSVAVLVAAYFFTHKPEPSESDQFWEHQNAAEIACLEGGGTWNRLGGCQHSSVASAAPAVEAPSTSDGGGSGGGRLTVEEYVDQTWSVAEQAGFCVAAQGLGYTAALRQWTHGNPVSYPPPKKVFVELFSRCL